MILPDTPKSPVKGDPNQNLSPQLGAPPSYGSQSSSDIPYPAQPYHPVVVYNVHSPMMPPQRRRSPARRFIRALLAAILIWILVTFLIKSIVMVARWNDHGLEDWIGDRPFPIPSGIRLEKCTQGTAWDDYPDGSTPYLHSAYTSFEVPASSDAIFLLSRGPLSAGTVDVTTSSDVRDVVKFEVVFRYYRDYARDMAKVCLSNRTDGATRQWWRRPRAEDHIHFETTVTFPESSSQFKRFETDVANTLQRVADLGISFQSVDMRSTNAFIQVESLDAETSTIQSSNGHIEGSFKTSKSLTLRTSNAHIKVDVALKNDDKQPPTELSMRTSNSVIEADINLHSTTKKHTDGKFKVRATSTNGPLKLRVPTQPLSSALDLSATTSNSPATLFLPPAYEGQFSLATSSYMSSTVRDLRPDDPSEKGRRRLLNYYNPRRSTVEGTVVWGEGKGPGVVKLVTSNSPVALEL
ncbi:hypothetical protein BD779DRAFT_1670822 [Infundibulicybe gibba]|nr:hypothetical protein BD779DRAFT_1670822 [Infundibulicybe gibba]